MAHFADEKDAAKFDAEFRSYLVLGVMDGPDLAPEVAKMEGFSGAQEAIDVQVSVDYMSGELTIVLQEIDWYLHNLHLHSGRDL